MDYSIYLISTEYFGKRVYKIGRTKRPIEKRLNELRTSNANPLEVLFIFPTKWGTQLESRLHLHFKDKRMEGEWFSLDESDIKEFPSLCKEYSDIYQMLFDENPFFKKYITSK
jgi:hypothetical protein